MAGKADILGRLAALGRLRLAGRSAILALAVLAVYLAVGAVAWHVSGPVGLATAAVAGACCWVGAAGALIVSYYLQGPPRAVYGLLLAMMLRTGVPVGAAFGFHLAGGVLAEAGLLYYLLVFYPVTLAVETALSLGPGRSGKVKSNNVMSSSGHD